MDRENPRPGSPARYRRSLSASERGIRAPIRRGGVGPKGRRGKPAGPGSPDQLLSAPGKREALHPSSASAFFSFARSAISFSCIGRGSSS